ncbi:hypothetical protein PsorP6_001058 [Peronosclerospora sorghi]|uniref:Uncharacterized protein n=1 Tax=Peronosclerospora sorghi TaxID=230839 RepID=A0ACC0WP80_9STRA|nr:hypothetical protein PsorP6_001058 [Peronosclerospora sorghi]
MDSSTHKDGDNITIIAKKEKFLEQVQNIDILRYLVDWTVDAVHIHYERIKVFPNHKVANLVAESKCFGAAHGRKMKRFSIRKRLFFMNLFPQASTTDRHKFGRNNGLTHGIQHGWRIATRHISS